MNTANNNTHIKLMITDGTAVKQAISLQGIQDAVKVQAFRGAKLVLADEETGRAPENISVLRIGDDLHISVEGSEFDGAEVIVEGYYSSEAALIGVGNDGAYHSYVAADGDSAHFILALTDGSTSAQVLADDDLGIAGFVVDGGAAGMAGWGWAALGALGLVGIAAGGSSGGGSRNNGGGQQPGVPADGDNGGAVPGDGDNGGNVPGDGDNGGGAPGDGDGGIGGTPPAPTFGVLIDDVGAQKGVIPNNGVTDDSKPTFTGTAEPNTSVRIYDKGVLVATIPVDEHGKWTYIPEHDLDEGKYSYVVEVVDADGNVSAPSDPLDFTVDFSPVAPTLPGVAVGIIWDDVGSNQGEVPNGGKTDDTIPEFRGTADLNTTVRIYQNGNPVPVAEVPVDEFGNWSYRPATDLDDGRYSFVTEVVDANNNVGERSEPVEFEIDTSPGAAGISGLSMSDLLADSGQTLFGEAASAASADARELSMADLLPMGGELADWTASEAIGSDASYDAQPVVTDLLAQMAAQTAMNEAM